MTSKNPNSGRNRLAVLSVNSSQAEWYEAQSDGTVLYGSYAVQGELPADLNAAALGAVEAAGAKPKACVLALGDGLVERRLMTLPQIGISELKQVLSRKAAALTKLTPEETVFSAREFGEAIEGKPDSGGAQKHWLLLAMQRSVVSPLRLALRNSGFTVKRAVPARLAGVCKVHSEHGDGEKANIVISVESDAISVSLVADQSLFNMNVLYGSLLENPQMASVLIQEVRSYEVFWRKERRGEQIGSIGIIGLGRERGELLAAAVRAALPETEVELILEHGDIEHAGRCESLAACLARGPLALDLTIPLPARKSVVAAVLSSIALITVCVGVVSHRRMSGDFEDVQARVTQLLAESSELESIEQELSDSRNKVALVEEAVASILAVRESGIDLPTAVGEIFGAFRSRATITMLSAASADSGGNVTISGTTDGNPLKAYAALEAIRKQLEESELFADVDCTPAGQLPGTGDLKSDKRGLQFKVEAVREDSK